MSDVVFIEKSEDKRKIKTIHHRGLVSIMRYDPHVTRCFEGIKLNLLEDRPTIVRVHAAANYPINQNSYIIDQEGHAILIVGYDDDKLAFAIIDPFQRENQPPSITWLPYEKLAITMVDMTLGNDLESPGLHVDAKISGDRSSIQICTGIPNVYGTIIDQDHLILRNLEVHVTITYEGTTEFFHHTARAELPIGSQEIFKIKIPNNARKNIYVSINVNGTIKGVRPYEYQDQIGANLNCSFSLMSNKIHSQNNQIYTSHSSNEITGEENV